MEPVIRHIAAAHTTRGPLSIPLGVIIPMPLQDRKTLLTICRIQVDPATNSNLRTLWRTISDKSYYSHNVKGIKNGWYSVKMLSYWIGDRWTDPIWMGLISMMLRTLPVTDAEAEQAFAESMEKEFEATQQLPMPTKLNYSFLSNPEVTNIHPDRTIDPTIYHLISGNIQSFREILSKATLYPRSSKKSTSASTKYNFARRMDCMDLLDSHVSLQDLEKLYSRGEGKVEGMVEMRQAWKYNDLKPRTYFACGGTMYYPSRYIQSVMNALVDAFPATDTYGRFSIERFSNLSASELVVLYDYTSFTSSMSEQKHFLAELAHAMKGTSVTVVDTERGPIQQDLGELIEEYNDLCNYEGEFTMADRLGIEGVFRHICASFLGVYGNISSCTALHGISLVALLSHPDGASVIGDDAMARFMLDNLDIEEFRGGVDKLGVVHPQKYRVFRDEVIEKEDSTPVCWHYAKRPVKRLAGKMYQGQLVDWPMIPYMITNGNPASKYHTVKDYSAQKCLKTWCMQAGRLLDQVRGVDLDPETEDLMRRYLEIGYIRWGLAFKGSTPHRLKSGLYTHAYPRIDGTVSLSEDWVDHLGRESIGDTVELPLIMDGMSEGIRPRWNCDEWICTLSPLLSLGIAMGWITADALYEKVVLSESTLPRWSNYLRFRPPNVYRICLGCDPPEWFEHMYKYVLD